MTPPERPPMRQAARLDGLLRQLFRERDMDDRLSRYEAWLVWDQIVGEQIARRARPLRFRDGILEVRVDNPVWMQQLQMLKPKILAKLNARLPRAQIEDIYLRRGTHAPAQNPPELLEAPAWQEEKLSDTDKQAIEASLDGLHDPKLKNELRQLFSLQKRLHNARRKNTPEDGA